MKVTTQDRVLNRAYEIAASRGALEWNSDDLAQALAEVDAAILRGE